METENTSLELECSLDTEDIDQIPDFIGNCVGYRFVMPATDVSFGIVKCPETTLHVEWKQQAIRYRIEDSESDSDVSQIIEEVLYEEHEDSSDLRSILM